MKQNVCRECDGPAKAIVAAASRTVEREGVNMGASMRSCDWHSPDSTAQHRGRLAHDGRETVEQKEQRRSQCRRPAMDDRLRWVG